MKNKWGRFCFPPHEAGNRNVPFYLTPATAAAAILLLAALARAQAPPQNESPLKLSGYLKNFSIAYRPAQPEGPADATTDQPLLGQSNVRLRLNLDYAPSDSLLVRVAYDISPRIQDPLFFRASPFAVSISTGTYRAADFRNPIVPGPDDTPGSFGLYHNLDRLSLQLKTRWGDLIVGRQPVAWGSARVVNPTDVIAPFSFYELDKEERFGVDAVRFRAPLSALGEIDAGYVFGDRLRFDRSAFFLRGRTHVAKTDLSAVVVGFQEDLLLGIDAARSIGGSGVWLEAAWVRPDALNSLRPKPAAYARLSAGIDRSLGSRLYGFLEYHYSSAGAVRPSGYVERLSTPAYTRGTVYLLDRHYLSLGATWQATPLIPITGLVIWNAGDGSAAVAPSAEYNISQNIYVGGGVYLGIGERPGTPLMGPGSFPPVLNSEFGSYPDFAYLSFRVYF